MSAEEFCQFCHDIFHHGQAIVDSSIWNLTDFQRLAAQSALEQMEAEYRWTVPAPVPAVCSKSLLWGAQVTAWIASTIVDRQDEAIELPEALADAQPSNAEASTVYSVDVMLRMLPSLNQIARRLDQGDPLLNTLSQLGQHWPLSSVGMPRIDDAPVSETAIPVILEHPGLRVLYLDRVLQHRDRERLINKATSLSLAVAVGDHPRLAGKLSELIEINTESSEDTDGDN